MTGAADAPDNHSLPWAPPRVGVAVERRDSWEVGTHGAGAGLLAGVAVGLVEIAAGAMLSDSARLPFDFAAALIVGPEALLPTFPLAASLALGSVLHVLLSITFGVVFLGGLALTFQLSARPLLMLLYGVVFGATVWEINFLAVLPVMAPALVGRLDLATLLWNGILSCSLVYGPVLAAYVIWVRPGMLDQWWRTDGQVT